jgi:polysaccharide deacetylase family protein (PEP-CTERM system associated)
MQNIVSVDIEDWFHILDLDAIPPIETWDEQPSIVATNTYRILDLFDKRNIKATFFVLGWVAKKNPDLIKEIAKRDHEIASHGMYHRRVDKLLPDEFKKDLLESKAILEDIIQKPIYGHRAPGFSMPDNLAYYDTIRDVGYLYDSSMITFRVKNLNISSNSDQPFVMTNGLIEVPVSWERIVGRPMVFSGGGYARFFPLWYIDNLFMKRSKEGRTTVVYFHPREVEVNYPRLAIRNPIKRFKTYYGLDTLLPKIEYLTNRYKFASIVSHLEENRIGL